MSEVVTIGHGSGGRLTHDLVRDVFLRRFENAYLAAQGDSAALEPVAGPLAFTTDGFVVSPLFFEGGDIGTLAVNGTVNDLAVAGARPRWLSAAFVIEEGFALEQLERVAASMRDAARAAGVAIVTGDTKVVEKGHGDGLFVTTAGIGALRDGAPEGPGAVRCGDRVLVSGPVGDHGAVIAAHRGGLDVNGGLSSDCGPVHTLVDALYEAGARPRFMRDPTRGGLATVLAELGRDARVSVRLSEESLPVRAGVRSVCDVLGLDPLYLACEGRVVVVVPQGNEAAALAALRSVPAGAHAAIIGEIIAAEAGGPVVLATRYGGNRLYDTLESDPLPRIC